MIEFPVIPETERPIIGDPTVTSRNSETEIPIAVPEVEIRLDHDRDEESFIHRQEPESRLAAIRHGAEGETLQALTTLGAGGRRDEETQTAYFRYPSRLSIMSAVEHVSRVVSTCLNLSDEEVFKLVRRRYDLRQVPFDFLKGLIYMKTLSFQIAEKRQEINESSLSAQSSE